MSNTSPKRTGSDDISSPSKRHKAEPLPVGFFDNETRPITLKPNENGDDDEWTRFQADIAGGSNSLPPPDNKIQRLELLGMGGSSGTIQAVAVMANDPTSNSTFSAPQAGSAAAATAAAAANTSSTSVTATKATRIDHDAEIEEEAADVLIQQLDKQKELYERVDRMKKIAQKQRKSSPNRAPPFVKGYGGPGGAQSLALGCEFEEGLSDYHRSEGDMDEDASDYEQEDEEEMIWRIQGIL